MKSHLLETLGIVCLLTFIFGMHHFLNPNLAFGCSCLAPQTPTQELNKSAAVFAGTVIQIDEVEFDAGIPDAKIPGYKVKFNVENVWKGFFGKTTVISTSRDDASCGYPFEKGKSYLVYALGENTLSTNLCTRTKNLADAQEDLRELGPGHGLSVQALGKLATTWARIKRSR